MVFDPAPISMPPLADGGVDSVNARVNTLKVLIRALT